MAITPTTQASPAAGPAASREKNITVLFADVAGSMDLQEQLDPEVLPAIMGRFEAILAEGMRRFGGTVGKFTGDGIMVLLTAPRPPCSSKASTLAQFRRYRLPCPST
ncbi:MAG: hypothetical protein ACRD0C_03020 [Acidimicrobiia bacterium]